MAEYLAVDFNGLFNSYKQNTEYLEAPIIVEEPIVDVSFLLSEAQKEQTIALDLSTLASLAQQALDDAIASLASTEDIATAQLALDEAVRLAQEAQVKAEEAQALAEAELNKSLIDKLNFNTLECDINKPTQPLNFITEYTPNVISTHKAEQKTFVKVDKDGKYSNISNITSISTAPYSVADNKWSITTSMVSIDNQLIIEGGVISISFMMYYTSRVRMGYIAFQSASNNINTDDITIYQFGTTGQIRITAGNVSQDTTFDFKTNTGYYMTFVIIPNVRINVYANGSTIACSSYPKPNDIPSRIYNYQKIGGLGWNNTIYKLQGWISDVRFYNKELSLNDHIDLNDRRRVQGLTDLILFNITPYFKEKIVYRFNRTITNESRYTVSKIGSYGNLSTLGTLTSGSDDRIKSHEVEIENATETLLKLTPKIYDKHPSIRFREDQEDNDLKNVSHFKESGLIAQEVLKDVPLLEHLVVKPKSNNGLYGMNYIGLIPYLIKSNQEIYKNILSHRNKINELKKIKNMT